MTTALQARPHLRGWFHSVAFVAAVTLCPIVIVFSPGARGVAAVYTGATIGLFGVSAAYHRFGWGVTTREVLRRVDHSMIFVTIAATYTPIALIALPEGPGKLILGVVWTGAAAGVVTRIAWPDAPRPIVVAAYLTVGWAALLVIDHIWVALGVTGFVLIAVGGLLHSAAAIIYASKRPDPWPRWIGFHEVFHLVGTAAIAIHYVAIATVVLPMATA